MRGLTDRGTPAKHKMSQANNVPRLVLGDLRINASASSSPRARHTPPQKARLPAVFGRVTPSGVDEAAASPETISTNIQIRAATAKRAASMVGIALQEVLFEREIYSSDLFRTVTRFGIAVRRLGSPAATGGDEGLAKALAEALAHVARAEEIVNASPTPSGIVLELLLPRGAAPIERWCFDLEIDGATDEADDSPRSSTVSTATDFNVSFAPEAATVEAKAAMGVVVKQIHRSAVFLPELERQPPPAAHRASVELRLSAAPPAGGPGAWPAELPGAVGAAWGRASGGDSDGDGVEGDDEDEDDEEADARAAAQLRREARGESPVAAVKSKGAAAGAAAEAVVSPLALELELAPPPPRSGLLTFRAGAILAVAVAGAAVGAALLSRRR